MAVDRKPPADDAAGQHGDLVDRPLQEEIELVGALVAAVSAHRGTLTDEEIDRLLGVEHVKHQGHSDDAQRGGGDAPAPGEEPTAGGAPPVTSLV